MAGERDRSFRIDSGEARFVLKIGNRGDRPDALEAQAGAMAHALAFDPGLPLPRVLPTSDYSLVGLHDGWLLQLTEHLDGSVPIEVDTPPGLRRSLGSSRRPTKRRPPRLMTIPPSTAGFPGT